MYSVTSVCWSDSLLLLTLFTFINLFTNVQLIISILVFGSLGEDSSTLWDEAWHSEASEWSLKLVLLVIFSCFPPQTDTNSVHQLRLCSFLSSSSRSFINQPRSSGWESSSPRLGLLELHQTTWRGAWLCNKLRPEAAARPVAASLTNTSCWGSKPAANISKTSQLLENELQTRGNLWSQQTEDEWRWCCLHWHVCRNVMSRMSVFKYLLCIQSSVSLLNHMLVIICSTKLWFQKHHNDATTHRCESSSTDSAGAAVDFPACNRLRSLTPATRKTQKQQSQWLWHNSGTKGQTEDSDNKPLDWFSPWQTTASLAKSLTFLVSYTPWIWSLESGKSGSVLFLC